MKQALEGPAPAGEMKRAPVRLILFGAAGATAFAFGFLAHTPAQAGVLVQRFGYVAMVATFLWWLLSLAQLSRGFRFAHLRSWVGEHRAAVVLSVALTIVAVVTLPYSYKILYDEIVLQATASNLHFFREFGTITRGYEVEGVFRSLDVYVDKRPFFYPFLVSLLHDLTGYRLTNAEVLNTLLLPAGLLLVFIVTKRLSNAPSAMVGLALFGSSSLLAQNAEGTGMELLNLAMFVFTLWLAIEYLSNPGEARLSALVLSAVLLAQTRYESALFVVPTALVILEGWRRSGRIILPAAGLFAPLLLIPCALHNIYLSGMPALWELREDTSTRFSTGYLANNLKHAGIYLFDFSGGQLNSWWLAALGVPAVLLALVVVARRWKSWRSTRPVTVTLILFSLGAGANFWVLMFYYWGQLDDPIVARLILPCNVVFAIAVAWAFSRLGADRQAKLRPLLISGSLILYVAFGLRATAHNRDRNELATEIAWEEQWLDSQPPRSRLMITNKSPLSWLIRQVSSISVTRARSVAEKVQYHLEQRTFEEVLVTQYYRPTAADGKFQLDPRDELPASYVLEPLFERRMGMRILRLSRVVEIKLEKKSDPELAATPANSLAPRG